MKTRSFVFVFLLAANLGAQTAKPSAPAWAAGLYGSVSGGYGYFSQPFKKAGFASSYASVASTGWMGHWDIGVSFQNRWGLRATAFAYSASNVTNDLVQSLEMAYPGYLIDLVRVAPLGNKTTNHFALGVTYAFPFKKWLFQPEALMGSTEVYSDWITAHLKETGTHNALIIRFRPENSAYRGPTLTLGARAAWYSGKHWGFFAEARMMNLWYNLQYHVEKTNLIEQTIENENIRLKKTAFGATAGAGIFLQITRWEKRLKKILF